jgi:hypothetical protein
MEKDDLSRTEALVVCRVLRWGGNGCWESNATIAKGLKLTTRGVREIIKRLVRKEWLAPLYPSKRKRILFIDPKQLTAGPLFQKIGVAVMKKLVAESMKP